MAVGRLIGAHRDCRILEHGLWDKKYTEGSSSAGVLGCDGGVTVMTRCGLIRVWMYRIFSLVSRFLLSCMRLTMRSVYYILNVRIWDEPPVQEDASEVTLGALSVIRAAIVDPGLASHLITLGLVPKLAAIVSNSSQDSPPPLPPRGVEKGTDEAQGTRRRSGSPAREASLLAKQLEEMHAALGILSGLAEHADCAQRMLDGGDLSCLLQVTELLRRSRANSA